MCFCASLVLGGPSQDGQPGLSLHQCRLKYCKAGWGQFEGQRIAWCAQFHLGGSLWGRLASLAVWSTAGVLRRATGFSHSRGGCILISSFKCLTFSTREFRGNFSLLPCFPVWIPPAWVVLTCHDHWFYPLTGWTSLSCDTSHSGCSAPFLRFRGIVSLW